MKNIKSIHIRTIALMLLCSYALLFSGCTENNKMYKESRILMDTYCTITVVSPSKKKAAEAIEKGFAEIKKLEILLNYFSDNSEIAAINRAAGTGPVKVSAETLEMMRKALEISKAGSGVFDPTIAPVLKLWKFSSKGTARRAPALPDTEAIKKALKRVDHRKIKIDEKASTAYLEDKGMEIDLGGIAKGYASDKAIEAIKAEGIKAALVAVAGDIRGFGASTSGSAWRVGIQDPRPETGSERPWEDIIASVKLENRAISTSGDYQRFFIKDGKRYHHIIDPATGFPAATDLISASVIAPEGYMADGLSTAVFALGAEKGMKLINAMGVDGVLIDRDRNVFVTGDIRDKIKIIKNSYRLNE